MNLIDKLILKLLKPDHKARRIGVSIGANCQLPKSIDFGSEPYLISIGENFYCSDNVRFITHDGSINVVRNLHHEYKNADILMPISIGNNVFLGYGVLVLPGVIIGDNVVVGANSLVKGCLDSDSVYAGSPTKKICSIDEFLEKNSKNINNTKQMSYKEKKQYYIDLFKN